jgi:hypothetical protein
MLCGALQMDMRRVQQELELKIRAAEQAAELLQEEKAEVMRLYESLQEQERQVRVKAVVQNLVGF